MSSTKQETKYIHVQVCLSHWLVGSVSNFFHFMLKSYETTYQLPIAYLYYWQEVSYCPSNVDTVTVCVCCVCVCVCVCIGGYSGTHTQIISGKWGIQKQWGISPESKKSLVKQSRGSMHAIGCPLALFESSYFSPSNR